MAVVEHSGGEAVLAFFGGVSCHGVAKFRDRRVTTARHVKDCDCVAPKRETGEPLLNTCVTYDVRVASGPFAWGIRVGYHYASGLHA